jgi:quinolinate synthase
MKKKDRLHYLAELIRKKNAVLVAHFYTPPEIQQLAEISGGLVGDSLEMARFGTKHKAKTLIVAGVRFMGESVKILNPKKKVLMPTLAAECSLDLSCPPKDFAKFCQSNPKRTVVVYINTSAKVKTYADWVVTSSIAVPVIQSLHEKGEKIIFAPDRYLGSYIQKKTKADMLIWSGSCIVHEKFKATGITKLKSLYPEAAVLVHPESPPEVIDQADVVGSTSQLLKASQDFPNEIFIVATDAGIIYQMQKHSPGKQFISAPSYGEGATCQSCAHCPWMLLNNLDGIEKCLTQGKNEIKLDPAIIKQALIPLKRMLNFKRKKI